MVFESPISQKRVRWTIFGMSMIAFILSIVVCTSCRFLLAGLEGLDRGDLIGLGLFRADEENADGSRLCVKYDKDEDFDAPAKTSRAFGAMAATILGVAFAIVVAVQLVLRVAWTQKLWLAARVLFIIGFVCTLITFSAFGTVFCEDPFKCKMGAGSIIALINSLMILIPLSVLAFLVPPPPHPTFMVTIFADSEDPTRPSDKHGPRDMEEAIARDNDGSESMYTDDGENKVEDEDGTILQPGQTMIEETILPNGSKKTVKTTVNSDGSKTIEETIEEVGYPDDEGGRSFVRQPSDGL